MLSPKHLRGVGLLALLVSSAAAQTHETSVRTVVVTSENPFKLEIQTSTPVVPQTQMVSAPERLVIDIPNALPGPALRGVLINRGEVRGVRISLFSTVPPVTRIVVDLNRPQWYRITPDASGLTVSLGTDAESAAETQPTIGWVSAKTTVRPTNQQSSPFSVKSSTSRQVPVAKTNGVSVQFANGLLTIHSSGATLSEVLFQIQKQTGAEIAIPSGTEQDRVAADFGPAPASEVLGELLNGSGMNFVVVGSEADPNKLRSVILTQKTGGIEPTPGFAQAYTPAPTAENVEPENPEIAPLPTDENAPPQQPGVPTGPPPDPPPS